VNSKLLGHIKTLDRLVALVRKGNISHAYLFTGPAGIGKRTTAVQFATVVEHTKKDIDRPLSELVLVSPDEDGKIGIDAVRRFSEQLLERPQQSSYRIGILNGAHRMTAEAQNALLKLAEEPPEHAILIVIAHDPETLYDTLRSRLQEIAFAPVPAADIVDWLREAHGFTKKDAETYARQAGGRPGLALRLATDEKLHAIQETAQSLLTAAPRERTALIKQIVEEETPLANILDALIREIAYTVKNEKHFGFWHALLDLRRTAERGGLNTRLQLEALFMQQ
jgi:DNA polymerase-3 subunit delta'